jgi:serine/threonine protein kinase
MTTFGRYALLEELGNGSMGVVYRARDRDLEREVALKTIRTGADAEVDPEIRERFYREARACARLQHPSIVVVYELGEVDHVAFISMELLRGKDFRKVIQDRAALPLTVKLEVMAQVFEALGYAHEHGVIHRDIKPSNLFLTEDNRAKVLDFGIARLPSSKLTVAGKILGTPNYMAPEQIRAKPTSGQSDLFSAAVVCFELLVYKHPFHAKLIPQRIVEGEPDSVFQHDPKLPPLLDKLFSRAFVKNPADRYQTCDEVANDIRAVADEIRFNASPSLARTELPSARKPFPVNSLPPAPVSPASPGAPPPNEDPFEWRTSEIMRLVPAFEGAIEGHDASAAKGLLAQIEGIAAVDDRFLESVRLCRIKYGDLASLLERPPVSPARRRMPEPSPQTPTQPDRPLVSRPASSRPCAQCGTANRYAANYCIQCGAPIGDAARLRSERAPGPMSPTEVTKIDSVVTVPKTRPEAPEPVPYAGGTSLDRTKWLDPGQPLWLASIEPTLGEGQPSKPAGIPGVLARWQPPRRWILLGAVGVAVLVLAMAAVIRLWQNIPVERALATAAVTSPQASLYRDTDSDDSSATLRRGQKVNVLILPKARDQTRVKVQVVNNGRGTRPGFVRTDSLSDWLGADRQSQRALDELFHPVVPPKLPPMVEPTPPPVAQPSPAETAPGSEQPAPKGDVSKTTKTTYSPDQIKWLLDHAEQARLNSDYKEAERLLKLVGLKNPEARKMMEKVREAEQFIDPK